MAIGNLFVKLALKSKEYTKGMVHARKQITGLQKNTDRLGKSFSTLKRLAIAGFAGWGIAKIGKSFIEAADTAEQYQVRLKVLLGSVEKGNQLFDDMAKYASTVSFQYQEIMGSATSLAGVMTGGGEEIKKWMPMIADLAAVTGMGLQETTGQVIRMYSAGAASADMFRERGILAMLGFQAGVRYTAEETREMMMRAFLDPQSKFKDASKELAKTWSGLLSMLSDKWFQFRNIVMSAGIFDEIKKYISEINDKFEAWIEKNRHIIEQKVPEYLEKVKNVLKKMWAVISYDPAILEWGLVGLALWGKKGGMIIGGLAHMYKWVKNLSAALTLASMGMVSFKEVAAANFKELSQIVKRFDEEGGMGSFVRMKMPKDTTLPTETWIDQTKQLRESMTSEIALISEALQNFRLQSVATWEEYQRGLFSTYEAHVESQLPIFIQKQIDAEDLLASAVEEGTARSIASYKMRQRVQQTWVSFSVSLANTLYALSDQQSKALFLLSQAAGIAQALVSAHVAAALALANPPGPPATIPLATATLALGYANAASIAALAIKNVGSVGGGGGMGGVGATGTYPASPYTGLPETPFPEEEKPTTTIIIQGDFYGDEEFIDRLADRINAAVEEREVRVVATEVKAQ